MCIIHKIVASKRFFNVKAFLVTSSVQNIQVEVFFWVYGEALNMFSEVVSPLLKITLKIIGRNVVSADKIHFKHKML